MDECILRGGEKAVEVGTGTGATGAPVKKSKSASKSELLVDTEGDDEAIELGTEGLATGELVNATTAGAAAAAF